MRKGRAKGALKSGDTRRGIHLLEVGVGCLFRGVCVCRGAKWVTVSDGSRHTAYCILLSYRCLGYSYIIQMISYYSLLDCGAIEFILSFPIKKEFPTVISLEL